MKRTEIARGGGIFLISHGNGTAYELRLEGAHRTIFVQGDDAYQFQEDKDAIETAKPEMATGDVLRELWDLYS